MNLLFLNIGTTEMALIALPLLIAFVYTLYHAATNKNLTTYQRALWFTLPIRYFGIALTYSFGKERKELSELIL